MYKRYLTSRGICVGDPVTQIGGRSLAPNRPLTNNRDVSRGVKRESPLPGKGHSKKVMMQQVIAGYQCTNSQSGDPLTHDCY
ncbi:hypothetical protein KCP71_10105 [Salmonella enterica subsp. enterica]|nr:hypothetical protein KCP71_10105 [Salmonella enterica subsp. enterica]